MKYSLKKVCRVLPSHRGTQLRVAALWRSSLPKLHKHKKSTTCSGANLTTVSVCGGICRALPFAYSVTNATDCIAKQETTYLPNT